MLEGSGEGQWNKGDTTGWYLRCETVGGSAGAVTRYLPTTATSPLRHRTLVYPRSITVLDHIFSVYRSLTRIIFEYTAQTNLVPSAMIQRQHLGGNVACESLMFVVQLTLQAIPALLHNNVLTCKGLSACLTLQPSWLKA